LKVAEKKPKKKDSHKVKQEQIIEVENDEPIQQEFEWDENVLNTMRKYKEKTDENTAILTKLRKDNNIDKVLFWDKVKEIRAEKKTVQKTK
jgi:hypothetical protein